MDIGVEVWAMKIKQKLLNPFVLIGQGFLAGALILYSTGPETPRTQPMTGGAQAAAVQQLAEI
jgi:hypothetical protein